MTIKKAYTKKGNEYKMKFSSGKCHYFFKLYFIAYPITIAIDFIIHHKILKYKANMSEFFLSQLGF
jgi:hypothetical protein